MTYFKSCTILWSVLFLLFLILLDIALVGSALWLVDWSRDTRELRRMNTTEDETPLRFNRYQRLGVYTGLGLFQYIFNLFCELAYVIIVMKSAKVLHATMLSSILRSNMQWFEATPVNSFLILFKL